MPLLVVLVDDSADNSEQETGGVDPNHNGGGQRKSRRLRHVGHPSEPPNKSDQILGAVFLDIEANILPLTWS